MGDTINILAICGSTRQSSSNLSLIKAFAGLTVGIFDVSVFEGLQDLPNFNPDDLDRPLPQVVHFKQQLRAADGILICTPEYAIGVPGALKNAIDWTVSSMEFSQKPVALITASTSGRIAHRSLLGTLLILEARITNDTQLLIPAVKTKIDMQHKITDQETLHKVQHLIQAMLGMITRPAGQDYLPAPSLMNE